MNLKNNIDITNLISKLEKEMNYIEYLIAKNQATPFAEGSLSTIKMVLIDLKGIGKNETS